MRDDYPLRGERRKLVVELESQVADLLKTMSRYTKLSLSELTNTALKRFITRHKDFLPPESPSKAEEGRERAREQRK